MKLFHSPEPGASYARQLAAAWVYLPMALLVCTVLAILARLLYGFHYAPGAVVTTALMLGPSLVLLGPPLRSRWWGLALCASIAGLLLLGNPAKIALLRMPLVIADAQALPVLFKTMSGARLALGIAMVIALLALFVLMLRLRWQSLVSLALAALYVMVLPVSAIVLAPVFDRTMPIGASGHAMFNGEAVSVDQVQDPITFLQARGPSLYLAVDWNNAHGEDGAPSRDEVAALKLRPWQPNIPTHPRNVHVVLLESAWDTTLLAHQHTDRNPMDPRFLALWTAAGKPYALSPVFGGTTANAEFEVLCGFPAPRTSVAFVNRLRNASPCLPAVLGSKGYLSVASHAHEASNWNRSHAYKAAGFERYRPIDAFALDDMEGSYLFDGSFFSQNLDYLAAQEAERPVFNYQVSLSSHWAYSRNLKARPDLVKVVTGHSALLHDYVNAMAYTTAAFVDWSQAILAADPDAIIVAFGDHAPVLGKGEGERDPYRDVNNSDPAHFDSEQTRAALGLARVPLLVIDGVRGPVKVAGDRPLYELPHVVSGLLGPGELLPQSAQSSTLAVRPFLGHLLTGLNGTWQDCAETAPLAASAVCLKARERAGTLRTLRRDTILGQAHFVRNMKADGLLDRTRRIGMETERTWSACAVKVAQWGPQEGSVGTGFNLQADGSNAVWISTTALRGHPVVRVGGVEGKSVYGNGGVITSEFRDPALYAKAATLPVTVQCADEPAQLVGQITIRPQH